MQYLRALFRVKQGQILTVVATPHFFFAGRAHLVFSVFIAHAWHVAESWSLKLQRFCR